jgi:hypothetical protein
MTTSKQSLSDEDLLKLAKAEIAHHRDQLKASSMSLDASPKPQTSRDAVTSLALRISGLGSTALSAAIDGEIYAARALSRSMQEHWIRLIALIADTKKTSDQAAGERYWIALRRAEELRADREMRSWLPQGMTNRDLLAFSPMGALLIEPQPSEADYADASKVVGSYGFKRLGKGILQGLAPEGPLDRLSFVALAAGYAALSGCVHGGPSAHDWLLEAPWFGRLGVAIDVAVLWASALSFTRSHLAGTARNDRGVAEAERLLDEVRTWAQVAGMRVALLERRA